jgi:SAM-dependent methyltransferase
MRRPAHPGTEGYAEQAHSLVPQYEALDVEEKHRLVMPWFPAAPAPVLDIGAGTGLDAAWFAARGHPVLAVEPTAELREAGHRLHPRLKWLDDGLPDLALTRARGERFALVMMTAVWMHLDADEREAAMPCVASLLAPGGRLVMALRHGPVPAGRRMFDVSAQETQALAERHGLVTRLSLLTGSVMAQNIATGVTWSRLVLERPA